MHLVAEEAVAVVITAAALVVTAVFVIQNSFLLSNNKNIVGVALVALSSTVEVLHSHCYNILQK